MNEWSFIIRQSQPLSSVNNVEFRSQAASFSGLPSFPADSSKYNSGHFCQPGKIVYVKWQGIFLNPGWCGGDANNLLS